MLAYQASGAIEQVVDVGGVGGYPPVEVLQGGANVVVVRRGASVGAVVEHVGRACDRARGSIDCRATAQRVDHRRELTDIHCLVVGHAGGEGRSEEHTSELQSLMRHPYAVCCL